MQTVQQSQQDGPRFSLLGSIGVFIGLAGVACSLTLLFLGMRSVMQIGGSCASGNQPFVVSHPCPAGVALLMPASIWGGLIFVGVYVWQTSRYHSPSLLVLIWPALFLSLGWNFLQFGLNPPGGVPGVSGGFLVCAVLFGLMGGVPLLYGLPATIRHFTGRPPHRKPLPSLLNAPFRPTWTTVQGWGPTPPVVRPSSAGSSPQPGTQQPAGASWWPAIGTTTPTPSADVVSALERLAKLHQSGDLDDNEYEAAKQRILGGSA
ncbi:MAG: SHOCT domain-containing protein [Actinomycetota bacterium]|nr:SHOCT domain-containing protein [Actinomycetota bacterium]